MPARDRADIRVRMSPEVKAALEKYAREIGMPTGSLCTYILGSFVRQVGILETRMMDKVPEAVLQGMRELADQLLLPGHEGVEIPPIEAEPHP